MSSNSQRAIRILYLHGFGQNADIGMRQTGALRNSFKSSDNVTIDYMNAPIELKTISHYDKLKEEGMVLENRYSWWTGDTSGSLERYFHFDKTIDALKKQWQKCCSQYQCDGYDGVMGFSQGACLCTILLALKSNGGLPSSARHHRSYITDVSWLDSLSFGIIVSGFITHDLDLQELFSPQKQIPFPTLHIIGQYDERLDPAKSRASAETFANSKIYTHKGGHLVPMAKNDVDEMKKFIEICREQIEDGTIAELAQTKVDDPDHDKWINLIKDRMKGSKS